MMKTYNTANELLEEYWKRTGAPTSLVDMTDLAATILNLSTYHVPGFPMPCSWLRYEKEGWARIYVGDYKSAMGLRFSVAIGIARYCLRDKEETQIGNPASPLEIEIRKFAEDLIMPKDRIKIEYEQLMFPTIERLAEIFMASKPQMRLRLQQMGLEVCDE